MQAPIVSPHYINTARINKINEMMPTDFFDYRLI